MSLSSQSPAVLQAISYCHLSLGYFATASYDSPGNGGGILIRLHMGRPVAGLALLFYM
jgi:hypothetical protein